MSNKPTHNVTPSNPSSVLSSPPLNPTFYSAYSPKIRSQLSFPAEGRTKQSFKAECDINTIMKRYEQTGTLTHLNNRAPVFGDMEEIDFQSSMNIVVDAQARFALLPSAIRDRFNNDPAKLLEFIQHDGNREEAVKLGLVRSAEPIPPVAPPAPPSGPVSS